MTKSPSWTRKTSCLNTLVPKQPPPPTPHYPPLNYHPQYQNPSIQHLQTTAYGNDDDSVSTLGNNTTRKWTTATTPSPLRTPFSIPQSISHSDKQGDDKSVGSISTLNTRINSIEGQFHELSGTMEQIKNMLNILANPKTNQDGDPRLLDNAGRGNSAGEAS